MYIDGMTKLMLLFQIAAQELSDNRVITLSMAGRKLDKKVWVFLENKFMPLLYVGITHLTI